MKEYRLGTLAGLKITALPMVIPASLGLWAIMTAVGMLLNLTFGEALVAGVICVSLHWLSELIHQSGHAWAARHTGYPMSGIRFGTHVIFATALYPPDEPALPAGTHLRRALGGPLISGTLTVVAYILLGAVQMSGATTWQFVAWFFFLENLLVMTLQALIPLGFNDGATIWHYVRQR